MKILKNIIILILAIQLLYGCDELVETEVFSTITSENFYTKESDIDIAVMGVYGTLQLDQGAWLPKQYSSGMIPGSMSHNWSHELLLLNLSDNFGWSYWNYLYNIVGNANIVFEKITESSVDEATRTRYAAEIRFIRAWAFFELTNNYGAVAIPTTPPSSIEDVLLNGGSAESEYYKQVSQDDIFQFVENELLVAIEGLPEIEFSGGVANGRVTKGSAQGLLARLYLYQAGTRYNYTNGTFYAGDQSKWVDLRDICEDIAGYRLLDNFADIFENANDNNEEVLFSIQYLESSVAGVTGEGSNWASARMGINGSGITPYTWRQIRAAEPYFLEFQENAGTERLEATYLTSYVNPSGELINYGPSQARFRTPMFIKFYSDYDLPVSAINQSDYGDNPIHIRYADILLMHSEAVNEIGGPSASALDGINKVRLRAGIDALTLTDVPTQEALRDAIFEERKWEFTSEFLYYFDCKRTGRLESEIEKNWHDMRATDTFAEYGGDLKSYYMMPIPSGARDNNPELKQNFGF